MIKRIIMCVLAMSLVFVTGCSNNNTSDDNGKLKVITTIFPAYDFARQIFGDTAEITLLLKPGMESHSFDPSAKDIVTISNCDLFIYNGGESDAWVESLLETTETENSFKSVRMMDAVEVLEEEPLEGVEEHTHEHEHTEDCEHNEEYDEHIWTSPKNAIKIIELISENAMSVNPDCATQYQQATNAYVSKIADIDARFESLFADEDRYFVFGDRFPLLYFFKEYGLNYYGAFPGCGSETEPSAQSIAFLTSKIKEEGTVKAVFYIELSNHKLADTLANDTGVPSREFHTCHNITATDFEAGETYVSLMERNYSMLKEVLE